MTSMNHSKVNQSKIATLPLRRYSVKNYVLVQEIFTKVAKVSHLAPLRQCLRFKSKRNKAESQNGGRSTVTAEYYSVTRACASGPLWISPASAIETA